MSETKPITPAPAAAVNPGQGLGIASLVVSLVGGGVIAIILGAIGLNKSKKAGQKNGLALAGIIIGAVGTVLAIIALITTLVLSAAVINGCNTGQLNCTTTPSTSTLDSYDFYSY